MTRCFLGFELTAEAQRHLREQVAPLHRRLVEDEGWPARMVPPDNWHLTLLFFPDLDADERSVVWSTVEQAVSAGEWSPIQIPWRGLALWPSARKPGLVCLEAPLEPSTRQWSLTTRLGEDPFNKGHTEHLLEYRPHITLMRLRHRKGTPTHRDIGQRWKALHAELPIIDPKMIGVDRISFFLSTVSPQHPIYPRERTLDLRA